MRNGAEKLLEVIGATMAVLRLLFREDFLEIN